MKMYNYTVGKKINNYVDKVHQHFRILFQGVKSFFERLFADLDLLLLLSLVNTTQSRYLLQTKV